MCVRHGRAHHYQGATALSTNRRTIWSARITHRRGIRPRARFRLYVEGIVVDEEWIDKASHADRCAQRQIMLARAAHKAGRKWIAEMFDPNAPTDQAYMRFGTDRSRMLRPQPIDADTLDHHPWFNPPDHNGE